MIDRANVLLVTLLLNASSNVRDRLRREEGQAFVEYAMVLLLVTVALAAGAFITPFQDALRSAFSAIGDVITGAIHG
jgi:Flp pilus assembly pilin Flp